MGTHYFLWLLPSTMWSKSINKLKLFLVYLDKRNYMEKQERNFKLPPYQTGTFAKQKNKKPLFYKAAFCFWLCVFVDCSNLYKYRNVLGPFSRSGYSFAFCFVWGLAALGKLSGHWHINEFAKKRVGRTPLDFFLRLSIIELI